MKQRIALVLRFGILLAVVLSLFFGAGQQFSAQATGSGTVSGFVYDTTGNPLASYSIEVDAYDFTTPDTVYATACTDPSTGSYSLTSLPLDTALGITAYGSTNCSSDTTFLGQDYWPDVTDTDIVPAASITLTSGAPSQSDVNLALAHAVPGIEYMIFNVDAVNHPITADPAVRHAIAYGTNRLDILNTAWVPKGTTAGTVENSYVADNHWAKVPDTLLASQSPSEIYNYNPALAAKLLNADGWKLNSNTHLRTKHGVTLSLNFKTTTAQARQDGANLFKTEMAAIGVQVNLFFVPASTFFGSGGPLDTGDFDIAEYMTGYCLSTIDEKCVPFPMFNTGDLNNTARYSSDAADAEYAAFQACADHDCRQTHAYNHQLIAMKDLPYFPLFTRVEPLTITGNVGTGGVTLSYINGSTQTVTSASDGSYSITVPMDWSGTVTPSKGGATFTPPNIPYTNVDTNQTAQNYVITQSLTSMAAQDGYILESAANSGIGGSMNSKAAVFQLGDDAKNKQYKTILSFDTSGIPATATIQSAVIKINQSGKPSGGIDPFGIFGNLWIDISKGFLGTSSALELADFNATASANQVGYFDSTPVSGWYSVTLDSTGISNINNSVANGGVTQFRLYFNLNTNNDNKPNFIKFSSGSAKLILRPQLIITYFVP
jgi:hypothetical protein